MRKPTINSDGSLRDQKIFKWMHFEWLDSLEGQTAQPPPQLKPNQLINLCPTKKIAMIQLFSRNQYMQKGLGLVLTIYILGLGFGLE